MVPDAPKVEVGRAERCPMGGGWDADVVVGGEHVAIASRDADAPDPTWFVRFEAPDCSPAWLAGSGTVEASTLREFRRLVREHVEDAHRRMVDVALAEACQHAYDRAEVARAGSMT